MQRIAQIWVVEKRMQFFCSRRRGNAKTGAVLEFSGWRYVHQEGWVGAVTESNGVCFMAALRGREKIWRHTLQRQAVAGDVDMSRRAVESFGRIARVAQR